MSEWMNICELIIGEKMGRNACVKRARDIEFDRLDHYATCSRLLIEK